MKRGRVKRNTYRRKKGAERVMKRVKVENRKTLMEEREGKG